MNKELLDYLDETGAEYEIEDTPSRSDSIPKGMREFYDNIKQADFSFGRIYSAEKASEMSQRAPFAPNWFVFGQDNYSSFWLCKTEPDEEGRQFTDWDHDAGIAIDEPVWGDLIQFLKRMEELNPESGIDWDEDEWE